MRQAKRPGEPTRAASDGAQDGRARPGSTACTVVGAACLWAWGYVANLSSALFPSEGVVDSIGIEFAYYASQLTVLMLGILLAVALRRWRPPLPPSTVEGAAVLLALASFAVSALLREATVPGAAIICCGVLYGLGGTVLTVAWGARFSLGSRDMRRPVLLSFLLGYALYLGSLLLPSTGAHLLVYALPLVSGGLWLVDSWRRHRLTMEVWPSQTPSGVLRGEAAEGSVDVGVLPWRTLTLFAATALVGNLVTSLLMGSTYNGATIMFPGGFLMCGCITCAAIALVPAGQKRVGVERLYRYCLPFAVLGMLLIMVLPADSRALAGGMVNGASMFLQALVILKATETTQMTGVSPLLSFSMGQGLEGWLTLVCAAGVFILFFLLVMMAETLSDRLAALQEADRFQEGSQVAGLEAANGTEAADGADMLDAFVSRYDLTKREAEVCAYLLRGRSLPFIAEQLYVTAGTVKTHAAHIYRKTGVGGKQELIDLYEHGMR